MAEDIRIIIETPNHGSRRALELHRLADNVFRVRFKDKNNNDVDVSSFAVLAAGKRNESDAAEQYDVSGTAGSVSGTFDFTIPLGSGVSVFEVPGVNEFRWWDPGPVSGNPTGRFRLPLLIHKEIGT